MAVDDLNIVDAIGVDRTTGELVLNIVDHLTWDDPAKHLQILQAKLNRYLGFLEFEECKESYPEGIGRTPRIEVHFLNKPPIEFMEFQNRAEFVLGGYGCALTWQWRPNSESAR